MERNEYVARIGRAVKALDRKAGTLYADMAAFVGTLKCPAEEVRDHFAEIESEIKDAFKVKATGNSTYRSNKSVLLQAGTLGQPITLNAKLRGKTELEQEQKVIKKMTAEDTSAEGGEGGEGEGEGEEGVQVSGLDRLLAAWDAATPQEKEQFIEILGIVGE